MGCQQKRKKRKSGKLLHPPLLLCNTNNMKRGMKLPPVIGHLYLVVLVLVAAVLAVFQTVTKKVTNSFDR